MRYEPATRTASGPQPGALALRDYAESLGLGNAGIYNPRPIRGSTTLSLHAEGRAVDITRGGLGDAELTDLVMALVEHHETLGVQQVIWQRRSWRVGRDWIGYSGTDPHTSHAHVELTRFAAAGLTVALIAETLAPPPKPKDETDVAYSLVQPPAGHPSAGLWWLSNGMQIVPIPDHDTYNALKWVGADYDKATGAPFVLTAAWFDMLRPVPATADYQRLADSSSAPVIASINGLTSAQGVIGGHIADAHQSVLTSIGHLSDAIAASPSIDVNALARAMVRELLGELGS